MTGVYLFIGLTAVYVSEFFASFSIGARGGSEQVGGAAEHRAASLDPDNSSRGR